jgi:hypothetical protein
MKTKFYTFSQNNSGGSFINDDETGISEFVIIEAHNESEANERAENIGIYFNGCADYIDCDCCGDRWYRVYEGDAYKVPSISGNPIEKCESTYYMNHCFVHYLDGTFKKFDFIDDPKINLV